MRKKPTESPNPPRAWRPHLVRAAAYIVAGDWAALDADEATRAGLLAAAAADPRERAALEEVHRAARIVARGRGVAPVYQGLADALESLLGGPTEASAAVRAQTARAPSFPARALRRRRPEETAAAPAPLPPGKE